MAKAYEDWFSGYDQDPEAYLARTFEEVAGYDDMVILKDIRFESHCEHHLAPIIGRAHVGYPPTRLLGGGHFQARPRGGRLRPPPAGPGKMNAQIAHCIQKVLEPKGVAAAIEAAHQCMTTRGVHKAGVTMVTSTMLGAFRDNDVTRREFLNIIGNPASREG